MFDIFIGFLLGIAVLGILMFPQAYPELFRTGILPRLKTWWPGFVKRHIVDVDPYDGAIDPQSPTRYVPEQYIDWNHPEVPEWAVCCTVDNNESERGKVAFFDTADIHIEVGCDYFEPVKLWSGKQWETGFSDCITGPLPPWQESLRRRPE